jgi:hypothetical protein
VTDEAAPIDGMRKMPAPIVSGMWACPRCHEKIPLRYVHGAIASVTPYGVLALGMDRPVHKCPGMTQVQVNIAMGEVVRLLRQAEKAPMYLRDQLQHGPVLVIRGTPFVRTLEDDSVFDEMDLEYAW